MYSRGFQPGVSVPLNPLGMSDANSGGVRHVFEKLHKTSEFGVLQHFSQIWILANYDGSVSDQLGLTEGYRAGTRLGTTDVPGRINTLDRLLQTTTIVTALTNYVSKYVRGFLKRKFKGGLTLHFGLNDQINMSSATVWRATWRSPVVWGSLVDTSRVTTLPVSQTVLNSQ